MPFVYDEEPTLAPTTQPVFDGFSQQPTMPEAGLLRPPDPPKEEDIVWENLSSFKRISRSFSRGRETIQRGLLGEQIRQRGMTPESRNEVNRITDRINELGGNGPGFVGWVSAASEFMGTTVESLITPAKRVGEAFTAPDPNLSSMRQASEAIDAVGEFVVPPVAMWNTFFAAEGGNTYIDLLDAKVDPQIASTAAVVVGSINASLEMAGMVGLGKPLAVATKRLLQTTVKEALTSPRVMAWVTKAGLAWAKGTGAEVTTEVLQELTTIAGEEVAKNFSDVEGMTPEEMFKRVEDTAIETFKGAAILGLGGAVVEYGASRRESLRAANLKEAATELKKILKEAPDAAQAHDQATAELEQNVKEVWISADAVVEAATASGDPGAYYGALGIGDQIQEAALLGGDVRITPSKYVDLLQSDEFNALVDHVRYDRDGMTVEESKNQEALKDLVGDVAGVLEEDVGEATVEEGATSEGKAAPTQAEIDEELYGLQAFFKNAKDAGMTDLEYQTYLGALARSNEARVKKMEGLELRKKLRENTAEMKARREELSETAREIVDNQPVYAAQNGLGRERLNQEKLAKFIGVDNLKRLPRVNGRQIYEPGGTVDPEVYAEAYGFEGPDIMAFAMMDNPSKAVAIKETTQRLFDERYIGLTTREQMLEMQLEALHTDESAGILALELNKLREAIGKKKLKPRILKLAARQRLRDYKLKDINPKKFLAAEKREAGAARKAMRKNDRKGAAQAKFRQLLNFQFAIEAYRIREQTKNEYKYIQKFLRKPKQGAALPIDYYMAIRTMLGTLTLKKPSLKEFVKELEQSVGITLEIPVWVDDSGKRHYVDLALGEWKTLFETIKYTEKTGLDENKFLRAEEKKTRDETVAGVDAGVRANLTQIDVQNETNWGKSKNWGRAMRSLLFNPNSIVLAADGFNRLGPVYNAIKRPYDWAMTRGYLPGQIGYIARQKHEAKRLKELLGIYTKAEQVRMKDPTPIPGVARRMSHQKVIMVLLNSGNLENRQALLDSGWTEAQLDAVIARASEKDVKFAQGIWDYFEEFWPEVVDATKRRRNLIPTKVDARPVETSHGTLRGGYFPLVYTNWSQTILSNAGVSEIDKLQRAMRVGVFINSMTRHGHTEERKSSLGSELNLELDDITRHVQHVIYDLEVGDATIDIYKILNHRDVKRAFADMGNQTKWEQLELWFADIVMGELHTTEAFQVFSRYIKSGFVVSRIAYNIATILQQPLGLLQSAPLIGKYNTLYGTLSLLYSPRAGRMIRAMSPMMTQRQATYNQDIIDAQNMLRSNLLRRYTPRESAEFVSKMSFWGLIKMQSFVDLATWLGAQRKGLALFNGDAVKAAEYADGMVIRTQGSGIFGERSPLERGSTGKRFKQSDAIRALVPLMSYFITKQNVAYERVRTTNFRNPLSVMNMAVDLTLMYAVEAWLSSLLVGAWPEDEDDIAGWAMWTAAKSAFAGIPIINWIPTGMEGFTGGGAIPAVMQDVAKFGTQVLQGEVDAAGVKAAARVGGDLFRLPGTAQAIRIVEGGVRAAEGEDVTAMEILLGPRWRE